jgi:hypothetical protein
MCIADLTLQGSTLSMQSRDCWIVRRGNILLFYATGQGGVLGQAQLESVPRWVEPHPSAGPDMAKGCSSPGCSRATWRTR